MKRYSGLHDKLCTIENIEVADDNARKNKNKKYGINKHDKNRQYENEDLVDKLFNLKYKTSKYSLYKIYEPKERILYIDLIIFLLILKLLNMIGVFILKIEKKILNLKYNILWLKINLKMILLELYVV